MERPGLQLPDYSSTEGRPARGLSTPSEPTVTERALRGLTHLPYRTWCSHCVRAKAKQDPARTVIDKMPVIQLDYCFMRTAEEADSKVTVLTAIDIQTGMSMATVVTQKGTTRHAVYELSQFLYEAGRAYGILQTDQEPAILDLARTLLKEIPGLSMHASPTYHSQSLGTAERYYQSLRAQARALRLHVHGKYGTVLLTAHAVFPWLARHASWLLSRYLVHPGGLAS